MYCIEKSVEVAASAEKVRAVMTTVEGFRAWFTEDTTLDGAGRYTFAFAQPNESRDVTFTLDRADEHGIAMTCVAEKNNPDWLGTELEITITPLAGGNTRVHLSHSGYRTQNETYTRCIGAWGHFMSSLSKCVTTGSGEPFKAVVT